MDGHGLYKPTQRGQGLTWRFSSVVEDAKRMKFSDIQMLRDSVFQHFGSVTSLPSGKLT